MKKEYKLSKPYAKGQYDQMVKGVQWIRLSEGCPNNCSYCAETDENGMSPTYLEIPTLRSNRVNILDMNLIYKPRALEIIEDLGRRRFEGKVIRYSLQCGIDYRHLTQELASAMKKARFIEMRLAWDYGYGDAYKIRDALYKLIYAGYAPRTIQVFMICNWRISYEDCCKKLDTLKFWGVQVSDCWFDNQKKGQVIPIHWTKEQILEFGKKCRDHSIMCRMSGIQTERIKKETL